jgi:hypothetical protein
VWSYTILCPWICLMRDISVGISRWCKKWNIEGVVLWVDTIDSWLFINILDVKLLFDNHGRTCSTTRLYNHPSATYRFRCLQLFIVSSDLLVLQLYFLFMNFLSYVCIVLLFTYVCIRIIYFQHWYFMFKYSWSQGISPSQYLAAYEHSVRYTISLD